MIDLVTKIFSSPSFLNAATLLTAISAYVVFRLNKRQKRKDAAIILYSELEYIEGVIESIDIENEKRYSDLRSIELIQTDIVTCWDDNKHLFVKKLSKSGFTMLDDYYRNVRFFQRGIERMISSINNPVDSKPSVMVTCVSDFYVKYVEEENEAKKKEILKKIEEYKKAFVDDNTNALMKDQVATLKKHFKKLSKVKITTTTAGEKIRKIAKLK